jgi:lysophospholipase
MASLCWRDRIDITRLGEQPSGGTPSYNQPGPTTRDLGLSYDAHTFASGSHRLHRISRTCPDARARLLLVHGYGDHCARYTHFFDWLAQHRIEAHGFDFRGHGRSSGRRGFVVKWDQHLEDLRAFLDLPMFHRDALPTFVLGHSHGGLVVLAAGERGMLQGVRGVMLSNPYVHGAMRVPAWKIALAHTANPIVPWLRVSSGLNDEWMTADPAMLAQSRSDPLLNRGATPRWFLSTRRTQRAVIKHAPAFTLPLLGLLGGKDRIADASTTENVFQGIGSQDKSIRRYPSLRHELLREAGRELVFRDVLHFMQHRL